MMFVISNHNAKACHFIITFTNAFLLVYSLIKLSEVSLRIGFICVISLLYALIIWCICPILCISTTSSYRFYIYVNFFVMDLRCLTQADDFLKTNRLFTKYTIIEGLDVSNPIFHVC